MIRGVIATTFFFVQSDRLSRLFLQFLVVDAVINTPQKHSNTDFLVCTPTTGPTMITVLKDTTELMMHTTFVLQDQACLHHLLMFPVMIVRRIFWPSQESGPRRLTIGYWNNGWFPVHGT
jgi:hypothetical protein